jgi:hypothetical protein
MARTPSAVAFTPDQQAEADRIYNALVAAATDDLRALADQLATTTDATIFGANEFTLRDIVLRVGAKAVAIALDGRKKGGTKGRAAVATAVGNRPASSAGGASGS